jgi:Bacterial SH3 domain
MRTLILSLLVLGLCAPAVAQEAPAAAAPYSAYVAPERGLRVREQPSSESQILATLWQGARVFVREDSGTFVRIDGYGVAGFAFVDRAFLSIEPVAPPPSSSSAELSAETGMR